MKHFIKLTLFTVCLLVFSCHEDDFPIHVGGGDAVELDLVAENLTSPVFLAQAPGDKRRLFVLDQIGEIRLIKDGTLQETPFLDLKSKLVSLNPNYDERGLLGLAFHPDYAYNGRFFVYYSAPLRGGAPANFNHTSHIAEFRMMQGNPDMADPSSERIILAVDQPQGNHNGGTLHFSPIDKYLYISLGDGGGANDVGVGHVEDWYAENAGGNGQDISQNLLGSVLRIDVNSGMPYSIPGDNPFVGKEGLDEIYAFGFRNPYRYSFDRQTGMLVLGDAGQALYEEIDVVTKGGNYGWNIKEGRHCFNAADNKNPLVQCPDVDIWGNLLIDPVIEFKNSSNFADGLGLVVVGGYVYRGKDNYIDLGGQYLFGVWSEGQGGGGALYAANAKAGSPNWRFRKLDIENNPDQELGHFLLGFGEDNNGEVYVLTTDNVGPQGNTGMVFRVD
ncbi:PQQ-dependent sugar dehydrogenase [Pontibacter sp. E15-1]|uniref:PQQ-dependent sugar dehydrogenase n=1 Tax=Pontibacter sp. E15-1 TaxID=2919918 RepID=UPI001F4F6ED1|nr:PQQ-dependent sugar dehydrogenase [Pontibacter sp. E15-1]MCJ8166747.1 PQQ-dependent sugar dehydrogenase [Pontibacter sp. E15-1]